MGLFSCVKRLQKGDSIIKKCVLSYKGAWC